MIIWAIAATAAAIILICIWTLYRRQVKLTCRQLAFLNENKTNLRLTSQQPFPELNALIDGMNEVIDHSRQIEKNALDNESQLKSTITSLSHDIRTPLTSLDGYFQLLLTSTSQEERERYIKIIQTRIKSLNDMLEELFTYTKLKNETYHLKMERCLLSRILKDTVFSYYDEWTKRGIEPIFDITEKPAAVMGNPEALRRMIQNIIKNGLDHGEGQMKIALKTEGMNCILRFENQVEHPEEIETERIFERFYKADEARSKNSAGLGLSIAKEFAERMGGKIRADVTGFCFSIEIKFPMVQ